MSVTNLIPKIDLPNYFTVTSMSLGPNQVAVKVTAETGQDKPYENTKTFEKTNLVLDDFIDLFAIKRTKIPKWARFFLAAIALPRDFELAAVPVQDKKAKIELSFELRGDSTKRWAQVIDTSNLNLADLGVLIDWVKEAKKYQR